MNTYSLLLCCMIQQISAELHNENIEVRSLFIPKLSLKAHNVLTLFTTYLYHQLHI